MKTTNRYALPFVAEWIEGGQREYCPRGSVSDANGLFTGLGSESLSDAYIKDGGALHADRKEVLAFAVHCMNTHAALVAALRGALSLIPQVQYCDDPRMIAARATLAEEE